jgi:hypothetical protein
MTPEGDLGPPTPAASQIKIEVGAVFLHEKRNIFHAHLGDDMRTIGVLAMVLCFVLGVVWFLFSGYWALKYTQDATDKWIGKPWAVPFVPFLNSETLIAPFAPWHALLTRGDWIPLASAGACASGTVGLFKLAGILARRACPKDRSRQEKG